jgi:acetylornithine/succinyldiaminopimelate/putrescine aminotransferase
VNAVLDLLDGGLLDRVQELGARFMQNLSQIADDRITAVRGRGLMVGVAVKERRDDILKGLQKQQILAIPAGDGVVRFLPPYVVESADLERVSETFQAVLKAC